MNVRAVPSPVPPPAPGAPGGVRLVSVVVPVHREAATVEAVVRRLVTEPLGVAVEVIAVDDGSPDESLAILRRLEAELPELRVLAHPVNRGKGAALRTGFAATRGDVVVVQDADLEYDPSDLPRLLAPLVQGVADAVFGTRLRGGEPQRAHLFWHYVGNRTLSLMTDALFNTTISDMEVGYKAVRGEILRALELVSDDFRIEPELTARLLRLPGLRLYEVPISYYGRTVDEGKHIGWRDGVLAVGALVRFRVDRGPGAAARDAARRAREAGIARHLVPVRPAGGPAAPRAIPAGMSSRAVAG